MLVCYLLLTCFQTVLPPVDEIITSRATGGRLLGTRWFDFSHAPDVAGFDSRKCKADIRWRGGQSFQLEQREALRAFRCTRHF